FSIKSEFTLFFYNEKGDSFFIGDTKILFNEEYKTNQKIPDTFEILSEGFFSLGQSISYYNNLKEIFNNDFESVLYALKDTAFFHQILENYERNFTFRSSLIRDDKAERLLREVKHIIERKDLSNLYNFTFKFQPSFSKIP